MITRNILSKGRDTTRDFACRYQVLRMNESMHDKMNKLGNELESKTKFIVRREIEDRTDSIVSTR
jgi:hypothetical protein